MRLSVEEAIYIYTIYIHAQIDTGYINPEDLAYLGRWSWVRWRVSEGF